MHGNVLEWCEDKFRWDHYKKFADARDPVCTEGWQAVYRGGSWDHGAGEHRSAYHYGWRSGGKNSTIGFRAAYYPLPSGSPRPRAERSSR